jgi:hypothetical protein
MPSGPVSMSCSISAATILSWWSCIRVLFFADRENRNGRDPGMGRAPPASDRSAPYRRNFQTSDCTTIGRLVDVFTPQECANYFAAAGYDAD